MRKQVRKILFIALAMAIAIAIGMPAVADVDNVTSYWSQGNLIFKEAVSGCGAKIQIGERGNGLDMQWMAETEDDYWLWDESAETFYGIGVNLDMDDGSVNLRDTDKIKFGDDYDVSISWDGNSLNIVGLTDDTAHVEFGSGGGSGIAGDLTWYPTRSGSSVVFDAGTNTMTATNVYLSWTWPASFTGFVYFGDNVTIADDLSVTDPVTFGDYAAFSSDVAFSDNVSFTDPVSISAAGGVLVSGTTVKIFQKYETVVCYWGDMVEQTTGERPIFIAPYPVKIVSAAFVVRATSAASATAYNTLALVDRRAGDGQGDMTTAVHTANGLTKFVPYSLGALSTTLVHMNTSDVLSLRKDVNTSGMSIKGLIVRLVYKRVE